jgi:hypothetical protein
MRQLDRAEQFGYGIALGAVTFCLMYVGVLFGIFVLPALLASWNDWRHDMRDIQQLHKQIREG